MNKKNILLSSNKNGSKEKNKNNDSNKDKKWVNSYKRGDGEHVNGYYRKKHNNNKYYD